MGGDSEGSDREPGSATDARALQAAVVKRARHRRRRDTVVMVLLLLALGVGLVLAGAIGRAAMVAPAAQDAAATAPESRAATIGVAASDRCRQLHFDRDSGQMRETTRPCERPRLDSNGGATTTGATRRLDAINKAFQRQ